jgi:glycosyltransferase involved in cell wall biosynthesis
LATRVATLIPLVGDVEILRDDAMQHLRAVRHYAERASAPDQVIVAIDGAAWRDALAAELSPAPWLVVIENESACGLPARLLNQALAASDAQWVSILPIGAEASTWYANQTALIDAANSRHVHFVAGYRGPGERRRWHTQSYLTHPDDGFSPAYPRAWLQMLDLVPMANALMARAWLQSLGGFSEARGLQRTFWWEWCLRAAGVAPIVDVALQPVGARSWHDYPFARESALPPDAALRVMMSVHGERGRSAPISDAEVDLVLRHEFSPPAYARFMRHAGPMAAEDRVDRATLTLPALPQTLPAAVRDRLEAIRAKRPLRIAVLGGVNEPAHNQLCFFNYFECMREWGVLTWRTILDTLAHPADLALCDLVIFSRVRSYNGVALMRFCKAHGIPTLYMLDDNWFWLGREWPEYEPVFSPGKPDFDNFLRCLADADTALTYNDVLADDMRAHTSKLVVLPTNVDLTFFPRGPRDSAKPVTIGYVGSVRKNLAPFEALVNVARARAEVRVFVMSNALPDELRSLPPERVHFEPYQFNYAAYAQTVCNAQPDILVAPVGTSRFEASKCPNKFLEITASGAAGVYSRAAPYTTYVREGQTGLLADDTAADWQKHLESLLDDVPLRQRIAAQALTEVESHFDTRAVLPAFVEMLLDAVAVRGDEWGDM